MQKADSTEKNMTCKSCGHKTGRVIGCAREMECIENKDVHYHCLNAGGCDSACGISGTCEPINDTYMLKYQKHEPMEVAM